VTRGPRALDAGPGAVRALERGGAGRVALVIDGGAGYVALGRDRWVLLAPPPAPAGPLSVRVAALPSLVPGTPARVVDGALAVGEHRIALAGARRARRRLRPPLPSSPPPLALSPAPPALGAGIEALARGRLQAAVGLLAGRGDGLTPAGDDVLAGYAGWKAWTGAPVRVAEAAAARTTPLSAAYLRCAERGELPEAAEDLIMALRAADAAAFARGARRLATWGATSGRAIMWGIAAAGGAARTGRPRPDPAPGSAPAGPSAPH
jgi:uncharacterized protein DUF2877